MTDRLLSEILDLLQKEDEFLSVRYNRSWKYKRPDNNIFVLASSLFILFEIKEGLNNNHNNQLFNEIRDLIVASYPLYKNKDDRDTYNFYPTRPSRHFAGGYLMQYFDHFRLPDDIDDTALISLTSQKIKKEIEALQKLTDQFAEELPTGRVYNTWYGKNMPKEQDVCALLNLLYVFYYYQINLSGTDHNTLRYIKESISKIESAPYEIARHYARPSLILYHYARFISRFATVLDTEKQRLVDLTHGQLKTEQNDFHRLVLAITLMKLNGEVIEMDLDDLDLSDGYTFIGAPLGPYQNSIARRLAGKRQSQMFWKSDIHIKMLMIEYLYYKNKLKNA